MLKRFLLLATVIANPVLAQTAPPANVTLANGQPRPVTPVASYCLNAGSWAPCPPGGGNGTGGDASAANQTSQINLETAIRDQIGAVTSPATGTTNQRLGLINTTLGSPFQAGGSIGNTAFGISGTLPAFANPPTVNLGTLNGAATAAGVATVATNVGTPGTTAYTGSGTGDPNTYLRAIANAALDNSTASPINLTQVGAAVLTLGAKAGSASVPVVLSTDGYLSPIAPGGNSALASSRIYKASAGTLTLLNVTTTNVSGYVMLFDSATVPADGAVTPVYCTPLTGQTPTGITLPFSPGLSFANGITAVFSTTGCLTKTASATAFFAGAAR